MDHTWREKNVTSSTQKKPPNNGKFMFKFLVAPASSPYLIQDPITLISIDVCNNSSVKIGKVHLWTLFFAAQLEMH